MADSNDASRDTPEKRIQDAWAKRTQEWDDLAKTVPTLPPGFKIDPSQVRMEVGPPMTEEQFKEWHERRKNISKKYSQ